jgi:uncharacterized membrane protein YgcG
MNRRQVVIFGLAAALAGPVMASGFQDEIVASLRAQGYDQITVEVTLLGRVKITAIKQNYLREIVVNPRTGEILRDLWLTADGSIAMNAPIFEQLERNDKGDSGSDKDGSGDDRPDDNGVSGGDSSGGSGSGGGGSSGGGSGGSQDHESDHEKEDSSGHHSGGNGD